MQLRVSNLTSWRPWPLLTVRRQYNHHRTTSNCHWRPLATRIWCHLANGLEMSQNVRTYVGRRTPALDRSCRSGRATGLRRWWSMMPPATGREGTSRRYPPPPSIRCRCETDPDIRGIRHRAPDLATDRSRIPSASTHPFPTRPPDVTSSWRPQTGNRKSPLPVSACPTKATWRLAPGRLPLRFVFGISTHRQQTGENSYLWDIRLKNLDSDK